MSNVAIETHQLGKSYTLGVKGPGYGTLREAIVEKAQRPFKRERREKQLQAQRSFRDRAIHAYNDMKSVRRYLRGAGSNATVVVSEGGCSLQHQPDRQLHQQCRLRALGLR